MSRLPDPGDIRGELPETVIRAGASFLRLSPSSHSNQLYFSVQGRFASAAAGVTSLYLADSLETAIAETICRNAATRAPSEKFVSLTTLQRLGLYRFDIQRDLVLLDFGVVNLARYRLDANIYADWSSGEPAYRFGPAWAERAAALGFDGIRYPSRHYPAGVAIACFEPVKNRSIATYTLLRVGDDRTIRRILYEEFDWGIRSHEL